MGFAYWSSARTKRLRLVPAAFWKRCRYVLRAIAEFSCFSLVAASQKSRAAWDQFLGRCFVESAVRSLCRCHCRVREDEASLSRKSAIPSSLDDWHRRSPDSKKLCDKHCVLSLRPGLSKELSPHDRYYQMPMTTHHCSRISASTSEQGRHKRSFPGPAPALGA